MQVLKWLRFAAVFSCQPMQLGRHRLTAVVWQTKFPVISNSYKDACVYLRLLCTSGRTVVPVHEMQMYGWSGT
jgi:hypothetical protein